MLIGHPNINLYVNKTSDFGFALLKNILSRSEEAIFHTVKVSRYHRGAPAGSIFFDGLSERDCGHLELVCRVVAKLFLNVIGVV